MALQLDTGFGTLGGHGITVRSVRGESLFGREGGDYSFEARIAAQRIPKWQQFQSAVAEAAQKAAGDGKLFAREIFVANPRSDHGQILDHGLTVDCIFFHGKKLDCLPALAQRLLFPPKSSVD
jgi:hypothetical protein